MALEGLETLSAVRVPDLDRLIVRRRREPGRVVGEDHRVDETAVALECQETRAPLIFYSWLYYNPLRLLFLEITLYQAAGWAKDKC